MSTFTVTDYDGNIHTLEGVEYLTNEQVEGLFHYFHDDLIGNGNRQCPSGWFDIVDDILLRIDEHGHKSGVKFPSEEEARYVYDILDIIYEEWVKEEDSSSPGN